MGSIVNSVADVFGIGPASKQLKAANRAADISTAASREAIDLQRQMYYEGVARQQPWLQAGQIALNKLVPEATNYQNFGMEQFKQDPGYAFRMSEGMKALENSAAARGGLLSGATMKGIQRYGQDMASQEYTNAFNRYQAERQARLNPLQSLAGVGQTTANALAQEVRRLLAMSTSSLWRMRQIGRIWHLLPAISEPVSTGTRGGQLTK